MKPDELRKLSNPYSVTKSPKLSPGQFIGREPEISVFRSILDGYRTSGRIQNVVVTGEKSIGKSSLLNRYKQILEGYKFVVFERELLRGASGEIDEFEFFKDIISELFDRLAPPEGRFFDVAQSEIWFSLTSDTYQHESDFKDRSLTFATQYSNRKRGFPEKLSYKQMERDFSQILDQLVSVQMEIEGFAILIDEFQELQRNPFILDTLRQLSESLTGLIVIGAGLPTFLDHPSFEKFARSAAPINLVGLKREEVLDLIFKPLEAATNASRHSLQDLCDTRSVYEITHRSNGNPLHVKILCEKMFDVFKEDKSFEVLQLSKAVMERVMEFYSSISEKSRRIRRALESCSESKLESFSVVFQYEGFTIKTAITLEMAFAPITPQAQDKAGPRLPTPFKIFGI